MSKASARGTEWEKQRKRILDRDNWTCTYCGAHLQGKNATVDHIEPISWNPDKKYSDHELTAACRPCNGRRQDAPLKRTDFYNTRWLPNGLPH